MDKNAKTEGLLGGFKPILGAFSNDFEGVENPFASTNDMVDDLTDEEIEALKAKSAPPVPPVKEGKTKTEQVDEDEDEDDDDDDTTPVQIETKESTEDDDSNEEPTETVTALFDAIAEELNWSMDEEDKKPTNVEDLVAYFKDVIEENSVPQYASEEVEKLDEFVRNGGNLKDYFSIDADIDLDNIEVEDNEINQKLVVKEFLKEKGFSAKQIDKKITKYEDAGILEDEAVDALEALKDIKAERKEKLLEEQQKSAREAQKQQQTFFNNVVSEIKGMDSIYGIEIPEKDKRALLEYIFKPDAEGVTKYQKDYAKSLKNLITSAYFTMKGDSLITIAKQKGKKDALDNFKNSLRGSGVTKKSRKQVINNDSTSTIWDTFARQLRVA